MIDPTIAAVSGTTLSDVSRARALDLLDEQSRRTRALADDLADGQRRLHHATDTLTWRSASRYEFDRRMADLTSALARSAGALRIALDECDRARELLRADTTIERRGGGWEKDLVGYPAGARYR
ncbi:hypothetical protein IWX78_001564 [Mycetocola sp. CAN_C7]|uniref:hypothetical protein n=1 Tax=Mycetocola sp. CAN_C7 TaxID=2787724 RepID=UPI0018CA7B0B